MEIENSRIAVGSACSKSLYARVVQRRAFTKWTNLHLGVADIQIEDVITLKESSLTGVLLEVLTGREIPVSHKDRKSRKRQRLEWERIRSFLESENPDFNVFGKYHYK